MGFRVVALSSGSAKESLARDLGAHHYFDGSQVDQSSAALPSAGETPGLSFPDVLGKRHRSPQAVKGLRQQLPESLGLLKVPEGASPGRQGRSGAPRKW